MARAAITLACLSVCLPLLLRAQSTGNASTGDTTSGDSTDVLVLDHDFTSPNEFARVFLQDGQVYRAELSSPEMSLQIRGLVRTTQLPRIYAFLPSDTPSGTSIVEVYPQVDAEYEIRSVARGGSAVSTRMRLYRDVKASRRRYIVRNTPGWEIGVELAGGWHSGFLQSSAPPVLGSNAEPGMDVEACFSARSAPGLPRLGMCVVGLGYQSQNDAKSILWLYTEPRLRLLGRVRPGRSNWELGVLLRFGVGMISASSDTPTILGPGLYVARHIRTNPQGAGWSLQASYSHASFRGFSRPLGTGAARIPTSDRLTFGVGWYQ
jgi:hypothetical protein